MLIIERDIPVIPRRCKEENPHYKVAKEVLEVMMPGDSALIPEECHPGHLRCRLDWLVKVNKEEKKFSIRKDKEEIGRHRIHRIA